MQRGLIALSGLLRLDAKAELPKRLKLLAWGDNSTRFGNVRVSDVTLSALPINQKRVKFDHVAIDFQHNSVPGTPHYKGEPVALAARSALPLVIAGEGLFLDEIDWTERGREHREDYVDLSACVKRDAADNVVFLHSGALCRQGEVEGITLPLAADPLQESTKDDDTMDYKTLLCTLLGLSAEATDTQIEDAAKAAAQKLSALPSGAAPAKEGEPAAMLAALSARVGEIETKANTRIAGLEATIEQRDRQALQEQACREGKVIPLSALPDKDGKGGLPLAGLRALVAELPVTVPVDQRTPEGLKALAASPVLNAQVTAEEQVRQQMGISEETWKKHNPKQ